MIMPFLIEAIEDAPPGLQWLFLCAVLWTAAIGAGSIVWGALF
jgi:hypothetical protein